MTVCNVGFVLVSLYFPSYILFCITVHHIYFVCVYVCMLWAMLPDPNKWWRWWWWW